MTLPRILYEITGTFEFELLIELLLRHWGHPLADDEDFRNNLFEGTASVLRQAADGAAFGDLAAEKVNLVFATWHVESSLALHETDSVAQEGRKLWLEKIKRALPSCFCDPGLLD